MTRKKGEIRAAEIPRRKSSRGRPTREEALRLDVRLLDVATTLFMERGFDGTSIDAVADGAGVSKPTVYTHYRDKRALFSAVLRNRIRDWLAPLSAAAEAEATETAPKSIETTLHELSRHMLAHALLPEGAILRRIVAAQAVQFPELARLAHEEGWMRAARGIALLLRQFAVRGEISVDDPELAAEFFLNVILGHSVRLALHGISIDPQAQERRRQAAVELFLNGVRAR
jgi:AcrR family transcriptional regulator